MTWKVESFSKILLKTLSNTKHGGYTKPVSELVWDGASPEDTDLFNEHRPMWEGVLVSSA